MRRNGFTLIEALITTVILVTGLAAVAGVFSYSSIASLRVQQRTAAVLLVSAELDEVLALSDRVAVIYRGQIFETLDTSTADRAHLGLLMGGGRLPETHTARVADRAAGDRPATTAFREEGYRTHNEAKVREQDSSRHGKCL